MAQQEAERYRKLLVRNRWQLALMLHSNPVLRGYRGHALEVMRGRENELKDAVEKENEKAKKKKGVSLKERLARMRCCGCSRLGACRKKTVVEEGEVVEPKSSRLRRSEEERLSEQRASAV